MTRSHSALALLAIGALVLAVPVAAQGRYHSLTLTLPPLSVVFLKSESESA